MAIRRLRGNGKPAAPAAPVVPSAADLDAIAEEEKIRAATAPKPSPLSTPPAHPVVEAQTSAPGPAPDSLAGPTSHLSPHPDVNWTDPQHDTVKTDSLGNAKTDTGNFGPKGPSLPPDVQTEAQKQEAALAHEKKLQEHMGSTVAIDSAGRPKGRFVVTPRGRDAHGMKVPDHVDYSQPVEPIPHHVGPRGAGAPQDTFHGPRPVKKN